MRQLKTIVVGHDLKSGGETALKSAVVLAARCWSPLIFLPQLKKPLKKRWRWPGALAVVSFFFMSWI